MSPIPLEDTFADIIGKAIRGLKLSEAEVAQQSGLSTEAVASLVGGTYDRNTAQAVASTLGLSGNALDAMAHHAWFPEASAVPGLVCFNTPFEDMTVNSYLAFDRVSRQAVAFDTGADCSPLLDFLQAENLTLTCILITHTHTDHILEIDRLKEKTQAPAFVGELEPLEGAEPFTVGRQFSCGALQISTRLTWGHSPGAITYVIEGLDKPVAIVGDALFASSMGGGKVSYLDALRTTRNEILSLPDSTILCPGHGPLTSVAEELEHNPFFAK